jgi:hypothetical protein
MIDDRVSFGRSSASETLVGQCKEEHELLRALQSPFASAREGQPARHGSQNGALLLPVSRRRHFLSFFSFLAWRLVVLFIFCFLVINMAIILYTSELTAIRERVLYNIIEGM